MNSLAELPSDLRFAVRALRQRPAFTLAAVATLALGIGANALIFSVVRSVLLAPLPYRDAERLVRVLADSDSLGVEGAGLALGDFQDLRRQSLALEGLAAYSSRRFDLTGGEVPEVVRGMQVSAGFFEVVGVAPAAGRGFLGAEEIPQQGQVAVLSDAFGQRRFAGRQALGQRLELDGESYEIVGVLPAGFRFGRSEVDVWVPLAAPVEGADRLSHYLGAVGRLVPGVSADQADAELHGLSAALAEQHPETNTPWRARVVALGEYLTAPVRPALWVLSGAVALLLLIACANVANLLLARGAARQKETAIRAALGSPRPRLIRLFLLESTLLALAGAGAGLLLARWGVGALLALGPADFPRLQEISVDGAVLAYAVALALVCGLAFGAFPAWQLSRLDIHRLTRDGAGGGGRYPSRLRSALVVAQMALALLLLIAAGLMLEGFRSLSRIDPGFDSDHVLALQIFLSPGRYPEVPPQVHFFESLVAETAALPGVVSGAAASAVPLLPLGQNLMPFEAEHSETAAGGQTAATFATFSAVTPGFFRTLRIPQLEGRDFTTQDDAAAPPVLVVDEVLARRYWPGQSAVGKRLRATIQGTEPVSYEIIGVVGAVHHQDLAAAPEPAIYAPYRQVPHRGMVVVLRTQGEPLQLADAASRRAFALDGDQPIFRVTTLDELVTAAGARPRFYTLLFAAFAAVGLALGAVGIYGVIAYTFGQRSRELAVRMALGARSPSIVGLVLGDGLKLAALGVALGLGGAFALTHLLAGLLFGVSARDPVIFTTVPLALLLVAALASYLPARRAVRVDPMLAIRQG